MAAAEPVPAGAAASLRLFFGLWPEPQLADTLAATAARLAAACGGRAMRRESLHMTLAFLGETPAARLPEILAAGAASVATAADGGPAAAFAFDLDRVGWWKHNRIVWAGCSRVAAPLAALAARLGDELARRRLPGAVGSFTPHVTLLRKVVMQPPADPVPVLRWPVGELQLVAATLAPGGGIYRQVAAWPLAGGGAAG